MSKIGFFFELTFLSVSLQKFFKQMLNRRLLRIKIFQSLYAFYQTDQENVPAAMKNLMFSLEKMHELFVRNLAFIVKIADIIDERHEAGKQKFIKPDIREMSGRLFSDMQCIKNLRNNAHYNELYRNYNINLADDTDMLRQIARNIEDSNVYKTFRESDTETKDMSYLRNLYKSFIFTNPVLLSRLEEANIHWANDQYYVGIILMSFLKKDSFFHNPDEKLPSVFKPTEFEEAESDEEFVKTLFMKTIKHADDYQEVINLYLENWEPERIALCDTIIMKMAMAEIIHFPQIPIKASLNEYIEMTKVFSTPKSKIFVNGILDKVISHYNREGKIEKIGRGLQDN